MEELLAAVLRRWREEGLELALPSSESDLRRFESVANVTLPADFALFLSTVGGMREMDNNDFRFLPLEEIQPDAQGPEGCYEIVDFLIASQFYSIRLATEPRGEVMIAHDGCALLRWRSFRDFLAAYVHDPHSLLPHPDVTQWRAT